MEMPNIAIAKVGAKTAVHVEVRYSEDCYIVTKYAFRDYMDCGSFQSRQLHWSESILLEIARQLPGSQAYSSEKSRHTRVQSREASVPNWNS
jgi:hypothetical protein